MTNQSTYETFLDGKRIVEEARGLPDVPELNPMLFDFQRDIVQWALKRGRAAIFADCGLGKTPMQLEWAYRVPGNVLIVAPLAVAQQTIREGEKFGREVNYARNADESLPGITITNYERMDKFTPGMFDGIVLDESSILKSYTGKYKTFLIEFAKDIPFRLACTATPAPNDHMEIGNHSEFLGIMPSNEMLARWFINDSMHFGSYRLKGHAVKSFWEWVSSWAVCMEKPSDLGYPDKGFILPPLTKRMHVVKADMGTPSDGMLFRLPDLSATGIHKEMRLTCDSRAAKVAEVINGDDSPCVIWCNTNYEADALRKVLPGAIDVRGAMKLEKKERALIGFATDEIKQLITKPDIAGFGMNWQHCNRQVFMGLSYSYERYYQCIRRCWRYGQQRPVTAHIVMSDTEMPIYERVMQKAKGHNEMQEKMNSATKNICFLSDKKLNLDYDYKSKAGRGWEMQLGDSCELIGRIDDGSVDFSIFSPPFSSLYIYSDSIRDMGNCKDDDEFFEHFKYIIVELLRATRPGRLCAVHCKNLVYYKNQRGTAGLRDFRGEIIRQFIDAGWDYHSEVTIWKDPVIEMQRTKSHGLLHRQLCKDSTFSRQGLPDYLVVFRKWDKSGEDDRVSPVHGQSSEVRFHAEGGYAGESGPTNVRSDRDHSIQVWQRYASPVWFDIRQTHCLNKKMAKETGDEKHICPLQLDVIDRALDLWTNPGDLVYSPFAGIGSEGYCAVKAGRRFIGHELKESYWVKASQYLAQAELENTPSLFEAAELSGNES